MKITPIDLRFQGKPACIAAYLLESEGELALVESGPASTLDALTDGLARHGVSPADISKVLLTHVHLDHAGAAGWWGRQGIPAFVHERGARHLIDPTKLIEGARLVYGDRLDELWGETLPTPAEQVTSLTDGDTVSIGPTSLAAWDTPGHAKHHHVFVADGIAFAGDVAGVRLPGETYISPTTAPSQFDPEAYDRSIARLLKADLDTLYLTHFGAVHDVADHLERYRRILSEVTDLVHRNLPDPTEAFTAYNQTRAQHEGVSPETWARYETANPSAMCAAGIQLYWDKQKP